MNVIRQHLCISVLLFLWQIMTVGAVTADKALMKEYIHRAYNFDPGAFEWFESDDFDKSDAMQAFVSASASYWLFQADRIDRSKRDHAEQMLNQSVELSEASFKRDKSDRFYQFLYGLSRCNRARFFVEESSWFRAYLDAREGLGTLRDLIEADPTYSDAYFALGVAECFLSDAPAILKPLARLLGFKGSAQEGIQKLKLCIADGEYTSVEAAYYLAYYYYNVVGDGPNAIASFQELKEQFPGNPLFVYFLGRSYQINRDPLGALEIYRESKEVCYNAEARDLGNWSSFRIGTILQGEQRYQDALSEYGVLQRKLDSETHHQEYFYLLPLKIAECSIAIGDVERAKLYLNVIRPEWDKDTYRQAKDLLKSLDR